MDEYFNHTDVEERNTLGVDVQGSGTVSDETSAIQYRYREMHVTRSQRGISLTIKEQSGGIQVTPLNCQYDISPDPHKDSYYDGNEQKFYAILAEKAMQEVLQQKGWPSRIVVRNRHFSEDYTLN